MLWLAKKSKAPGYKLARTRNSKVFLKIYGYSPIVNTIAAEYLPNNLSTPGSQHIEVWSGSGRRRGRGHGPSAGPSAELLTRKIAPLNVSRGEEVSVGRVGPVGFSGRGCAALLPREIPNKLIWRASAVPRPSPSPLSGSVSFTVKLAQFYEFFSGKRVDDLVIYDIMETYIFKEAQGLPDLQNMIQLLSALALNCHQNVHTICKYLYVFTQDPRASDLRTVFFSSLEADFFSRGELRNREGASRYRNFIRWIMAAAHHCRDLLYAPSDDLMLGLLELAEEISEFNEKGDTRLYVTLVLRHHYYSSLPLADGADAGSKWEEHSAIEKARIHVRQRLDRGGLSVFQKNWLILFLEVNKSSPLISEELVHRYQDVLPGLADLLPKSLEIKLPKGCQRVNDLKHIAEFVSCNR